MMQQLMKKNDELQLNQLVGDLKLAIREKEVIIKDLEREKESLQMRHQSELDQVKKSNDEEFKKLTKAILVKERELKQATDSRTGQTAILDRIKKEQLIVSSCFHRLGMELYQKQMNV